MEETNTHGDYGMLGTDDFLYSDIYNNKICCKSGLGVTRAHWQNMNGVATENADLEDTVKMAVYGAGNVGDTVIFEIYENDCSEGIGTGGWTCDDKIRTQVNGNAIEGIIDDSGAAIGYWTITQDDLDKTDDYSDFVFLMNGDVNNPSGNLEISEIVNDTPITIKINKPECGDYNWTEVNLDFEIEILDEDDLIRGSLDFGDSASEEITNGLKEFVHNYSSDGSISVELSALNDREERKVTYTNIMLLKVGTGGRYVAACIDEPEDYSNIEEGEVKFNALSTRAIEYNGGDVDIISLPNERLEFKWTFKSANQEDDVTDWLSGDDEFSYHFWYVFTHAGNNGAQLDVSFE